MTLTPSVSDAERLLKLARAAKLRRSSAMAPIEPVERGGALALSFAQQRLWFLEQLGGTGGAYHIPNRLHLRGELDREALVRALERTVARHEALRTVFTQVDGQPVQRVQPAEQSTFRLVDHDLSGHPEAEAELSRLMADEVVAPFDLERGPLIRGRLIRRAPDDHVLLITMHHIVSDAWSMDVFSREVTTLYRAFRRGEPDPLFPPLPVQYADYAAWQRRWVDGEVLAAQTEYWKRTLAGAPELLELPTDHPRPARPDHAGASVALDLDEELSAGLRALSQRHGTTLFMTLLAGWAVVLGRLSGQADVVVGTPSANRQREEIEGLIGFFVNTLALRVDLSGSPSVARLLERVKERALGAQSHQDIPFEQVVELVQPTRSLAYTPLVQVMFNWQGASQGGVRPPAERSPRITARFDLSLILAERGGRITGNATYATALFGQATVERYLGYLRRVLEAMVADDRQAVDALPLLPEAERRLVVEEWNATGAAYPSQRVHELFAAQAARTPEAVAVVFGEERVTYAELDARANRLARHLGTLGVGPDARVGLFLERSAETVVGVLAILKAGAAYVALDPSYPDERLRFMLRDAGAGALVTRTALESRLSGWGGATVRLDADAETIARESAAAPPIHVSPENLAYVIYTSGSTGEPKGVLIEHGGLSNYLAFFDREILGEGFALPMVSRLSFDAHVRQLYPPLLRGEAVWVLPEEVVTDPVAILDALASRERVSFGGVPSLWSAVLDAIESGAHAVPGDLRAVLLGGEALSPELVRRTLVRFPGVRIWNHYGPTEATVNTTVARVEDADRVNLGRPIANVRVYLLDAHGNPVPAGVAGELYVGGVGVSRGYLGRPALTAEKYLPDPFSAEPGARMYRSGDRVRWLPNGELEYLGRVDHQVKVRGFRIELGEIEARLRQHADVRDAVVIAREDAPGDGRLVAYYVGAAADAADGAGAVEAEALRGHLATSLPEHMVPAAYVRLDALPLTPNGKVDRKALPAPDGEAYAARGYEPPLGEAEEALAEIWSDVLGVERVGRRDNFFELGGHSLLAVRVISRVRQTLGVQAALGDVFLRPVLADFARGMEQAGRAELPPIEPVERTDRLPLSFAQQRLWFLEQMGGMGSTYHIPKRLRLRGELDADALARALDRIVARHEALRTTFTQVDGAPVQRVLPVEQSPFRLLDHDLSAHPAAEPELRRLVDEEARAPFDLERGPLIRGRLIRLAADNHVLLLTMHHIVSDGWSSGVLTRELGTLYDAFRRGEEDPLPPLPVQYADYAAWQRKWVDGEVLREQAEYWKRTLAGAPELLELPTDRPRPARQDHAGASVAVELDEALTAGLKALGQRHGTTLFMTVLAGWAAVLGRLSGQDDVVVGTPAANRGRREIEGLIGFFVNTLALRVELCGSPSVSGLLGRVKERALEAQHHQDIPFEQVVELVQPARSMSHSPLFQVMFAWENASRGRLELPGLRAGGVGRASQVAAKFDLSLSLGEADGRIAGSVDYATALFERETIERHLVYLRRVLEAFVADDLRAVDALPLLPEAERRLVVEEWNATDAAYPAGLCIHELFEAQAARTPDAVAVVFEDGSLSYAGLNARSNRLANHLRELGAGPDERVAICAERGVEMVVALLAVLKAGGAYVPLDPAYPEDRLRLMLEDSAPVAVLTHGTPAARFAGASVPVLDLAADAPAWAGRPDTNPGRAGLTPDHLAYVIYTSGSTGMPKGVMNAHRGVVNRLRWMQDAYALDAGDAVLQKTTYAFDVSVWEFFWTLAAGARLVMATPGGHRDPGYLADTIRREAVTTVHFVPSMLQPFLEHPGAAACTGLRRVVCSGEALPPALAEHFLQRLPGTALHNLYGPTEAAVDVTAWRCVPGDAARARVPLGRPIANTRIYVLDGGAEPAPPGVAGELYIGGVQVARGYQNRPGLTAERFVADPFGGPGARLYRTGDLGRWLPDGTLEYLGRNDFQVKVRGFRIEPGEIEARLVEHPQVRDAVVLARHDAPGDARLVAYVVAAEGADAEALRAHLSRRVPEHMVPAAFVRLETLPLTPNGKLDRRALPAPERDAFAARGYERPLGEVEERLAAIWSELLGVERVGRHDHFFELGGHSLLAVQVVSRVRQLLGAEVALGDVFLRPVLADFARGVEQATRAELSPIAPADREGRLPLSFAQQRLWFLEQLGGAGSAYHVPTRLRLRGELDRPALVRALDRIVARHEALRTVFPMVDGEAEQRIAPVEESAFRLLDHDLRGHPEAGAELRRLIAGEAAAPFDLARGPLIRGRLVRTGDDDHVLLITLHHIVSDGWSMGVLTRELGALYGAFREGRPDPLPPLPVQYADYAAWQRGRMEGELLARQADYWTQALAGAPELLELPADHPRPARQDFAGASLRVAIGEDLTARLQALSRRHGTTLFMTVLAGWAVLLSRLSGQDDVVVGTPSANRDRAEVEGLIGFFVNTLAVRVDLSGSPAVGELLGRVRARALEAQANGDIPFEQVVDLVQPARSLSHTPLFQVMLAWQSVPKETLAMPGLEQAPAAAAPGVTAKFDLLLGLSESGGRIVGAVDYATSLFERATVERWVGYFRRVLEEMAADDARGVDALPLLPEAERRQVVHEWNAAGAAHPAGPCLHEGFEARVERAPDAVALVFAGEALSYGELNRRANRLARHLAGRGVGPGARVAICAERGVEMVVALLAVLKAGGGYVPLNPAYPGELLRSTLEDSRPVLLLTQAALRGRFAEVDLPVLALDADARAWAAEPDADLRRADVTPGHLAYVIYTSGSTGRPKGVMVPHGNVARLFAATDPWFGFGPADVWTLFHSFAFDFSVWEIWGALLHGGRLVVVDHDTARSPADFHRLLCREGVTVLNQTPSAFRQLIAADAESGERHALREVVFGGEALEMAMLKPWFERHGDRSPRLVNMYGITETTVHVTYLPLEAADAGRRGPSPIGRRIPDLRAYVVDGRGEPVPVGVAGELYVGGAGVARGYLGRPGLTAERFVADPFGGDPGARLYRTGDLARWLPDGTLEYLGRNDQQVKIRGFRIELGEIEARLAGHPALRDAVVLAREDTPGDRRLVAWYVAAEPVEADLLRVWLSERLAEHMVPSAYVRLDALPLTPNGKLDRGALPAPEGDAYARRGYEAPVGETEEVLAEIWAELLGVERVGRHDHFFELGGHSLLAVRLIDRMRQRGLHVEVRALFITPTLAEVAAAAVETDDVEVPASLAPGAEPGATMVADDEDDDEDVEFFL